MSKRDKKVKSIVYMEIKRRARRTIMLAYAKRVGKERKEKVGMNEMRGKGWQLGIRGRSGIIIQ